MRKFSRLFALMLAICMLATLVACTNEPTETNTTDEATTTLPEESTTPEVETTEEETTTVADTTEETTEEVTTEEETDPVELETVIAKDGTVIELDKYGVAYNDDGTINSYSKSSYTDVFEYKGTYYDSIQEAFDAVQDFWAANEDPSTKWTNGFTNIKGWVDYQTGEGYDDYTFGPVYVNVPDDNNFYGMYYNCNECDIRFSIGVTYDDCSATPGYAYYSQLWRLDMNLKLDGTCVYIWSGEEGFTPGYYRMTLVNDTGTSWDYNVDGKYNYDYTRIGDINDHWPYAVVNHE